MLIYTSEAAKEDRILDVDKFDLLYKKDSLYAHDVGCLQTIKMILTRLHYYVRSYCIHPIQLFSIKSNLLPNITYSLIRPEH